MTNCIPTFLGLPALQCLFDTLDCDNAPTIRIVGGAVRNHLLGVPVKDIDLATLLTPQGVIEKCKAVNLNVFPTGIDHGTVTVVINGTTFEVTTLRKDVATDGRRAVVAFSKSWTEDAARRDFTVNALYMDRHGEVFDPLGQGLDDIKASNIRFIGDAATRIKEDALRILRFFRFSALYGRSEIDQKGLDACTQHRDLLKKLSKERVTDELMKICSLDQYVDGSVNKFVDIMGIIRDNSIIGSISDADIDVNSLSKLSEKQKQHELYRKETLLYYVFDKNVELINQCLVLSKKQQKYLVSFYNCHNENNLNIKKMLYKYGKDIVQQVLLSGDASDEDLSLTNTWSIPVFPLTGKDLLRAGYKAGPDMGAALSTVEKWWIDKGFTPNKEDCLLQLKPI